VLPSPCEKCSLLKDFGFPVSLVVSAVADRLSREFYRAPVPVRISLPHSESSLLGFSQSQSFGLRAQLSREIIHFSSWEQERTGQEFLFTALLIFF
jgi:hypothetical protein